MAWKRRAVRFRYGPPLDSMKISEIESRDREKTLLVDIREADELHATPSIPGAINIPLSRLIQEVEAGKLPMDKKIITICRSGGRCYVANSELSARGYDADLLEGGIIEYLAQNN